MRNKFACKRANVEKLQMANFHMRRVSLKFVGSHTHDTFAFSSVGITATADPVPLCR